MHFLGFSFQNFKLLFILILVFLTHTFNSQKNKNSIKKSKNKTTNLTGGGQQSLLLLTFSGAILGSLLFISVSALFFRAPSLLYHSSNPLQLGCVPLLALYQVPEGLPDSLVLLHKLLECFFDGT